MRNAPEQSPFIQLEHPMNAHALWPRSRRDAVDHEKRDERGVGKRPHVLGDVRICRPSPAIVTTAATAARLGRPVTRSITEIPVGMKRMTYVAQCGLQIRTVGLI